MSSNTDDHPEFPGAYVEVEAAITAPTAPSNPQRLVQNKNGYVGMTVCLLTDSSHFCSTH